MNEELFRKKSLERVKSPESINDYIQVSNPGIWLLLAAVIALLLGAVIWGIFGYVDTTVKADAVFSGGTATVTVDSADIKTGMTVTADGVTGSVTAVDFFSPTADSEEGAACRATVAVDIPDGSYTVAIITERTHPISFVLN